MSSFIQRFVTVVSTFAYHSALPASMGPPDEYHQQLQSLTSTPEPEAAEASRKAFFGDTAIGGLTLM